MPVNLQIGDDRVLKSAAAVASVEGTMRSTSKALEHLLLSSNKLRQKSEVTVSSLEAIPRTRVLEHALTNQTPSCGSGGK